MAPEQSQTRNRTESPVQVVDKVAAILSVLAERGYATAAELSESVDEPRSSIYRLLKSLRQHDLVEAGPHRGTFKLGFSLLRLSDAVISGFDVRQAALPALHGLHDHTGETVYLCIRRGVNAVCIDRIEGARVQSYGLRLGGSLPLHTGAGPTTLLAYDSEAAWKEYFRGAGPVDSMAGKAISFKHLADRLTEIRERGYSISDEDVTVGIAAVGAPIFDYKAEVSAALSISGTRPAILGDKRDEILALTTKAAEGASAALGHRPVSSPLGAT